MALEIASTSTSIRTTWKKKRPESYFLPFSFSAAQSLAAVVHFHCEGDYTAAAYHFVRRTFRSECPELEIIIIRDGLEGKFDRVGNDEDHAIAFLASGARELRPRRHPQNV